MDVVLSIRVTNEDWEKLRRVAKPPARSVSPIISEIIMAYERKEKHYLLGRQARRNRPRWS